MIKAKLTRNYFLNYTSGIFEIELDNGMNFQCFSLERPWKNNLVNYSCIPTGKYLVKPDNSGKHQFFKITEVKGRSGIEIHIGNEVEETEGCLLLGLGIEYSISKSHCSLISSGMACNYLKEVVTRPFYLDIV